MLLKGLKEEFTGYSTWRAGPKQQGLVEGPSAEEKVLTSLAALRRETKIRIIPGHAPCGPPFPIRASIPIVSQLYCLHDLVTF